MYSPFKATVIYEATTHIDAPVSIFTFDKNDDTKILLKVEEETEPKYIITKQT